MEKPAETNYPIEEILKRRWSPRAFSNRMVEPEQLRSLWEAARWAPSSFNEQPWHFIVATKENKEVYERLLSCLVEKNQKWARNAPVLMVSVTELNFARNGKPNRHSFHDVGLAMGNLLVEATALGLFVHQMAGFSPDKVKELFAVPEGFEPVAGIAIGYGTAADEAPEGFKEQELAPRSRKPIDSFAFEGTWGRPRHLLRNDSARGIRIFRPAAERRNAYRPLASNRTKSSFRGVMFFLSPINGLENLNRLAAINISCLRH